MTPDEREFYETTGPQMQGPVFPPEWGMVRGGGIISERDALLPSRPVTPPSALTVGQWQRAREDHFKVKVGGHRVCVVCGEHLTCILDKLAAAEAENAALRERIAVLEAALRAVEWKSAAYLSGDSPVYSLICPSCGCQRAQGHKLDCIVGRALAARDGAPS